jgi:UDP-glucose-4-epimerase GalE
LDQARDSYIMRNHMETILVTGGAGYIGSHAVRELARCGYFPVIVDNLSEGHLEAVIEGDLKVGDLRDGSFLDALFENYRFSGVMHFASRCYVGESVENPRLYYEQNLGGGMNLLRAMLKAGARNFIFSSSCATYGAPIRVPMDEEHPQDPVNPYGETKYFLERILRQYDRAYGLRYTALRYFNAAGASLDGLLGESHDPESHLIPRVLKVATGELKKVGIFGDDYPTRDGSCVRDYIHVQDLATAHVAAFRRLADGAPSDFFNLGTGQGYTVKEVVNAARAHTGRDIRVEIAPRRSGDPPELVADATKANRELGWIPAHSDLETIVRTAWSWEQNRRY